MKRYWLLVTCLFGAFTILSPAIAGDRSTLQADIDAGAVLLTTADLRILHTNNTLKGRRFVAYYPEGKKRIIKYKGKRFTTKWWIDENYGSCVISVRTKKKMCGLVARIGDNKFRTYENNTLEDANFSVLEGNPEGLK